MNETINLQEIAAKEQVSTITLSHKFVEGLILQALEKSP